MLSTNVHNILYTLVAINTKLCCIKRDNKSCTCMCARMLVYVHVVRITVNTWLVYVHIL